MLAAAVKEHADWGVVITGHSLGAGLAALIGMALRVELGDRLSCWAFCPPVRTSLASLPRHLTGSCMRTLASIDLHEAYRVSPIAVEFNPSPPKDLTLIVLSIPSAEDASWGVGARIDSLRNAPRAGRPGVSGAGNQHVRLCDQRAARQGPGVADDMEVRRCAAAGCPDQPGATGAGPRC